MPLFRRCTCFGKGGQRAKSLRASEGYEQVAQLANFRVARQSGRRTTPPNASTENPAGKAGFLPYLKVADFRIEQVGVGSGRLAAHSKPAGGSARFALLYQVRTFVKLKHISCRSLALVASDKRNHKRALFLAMIGGRMLPAIKLRIDYEPGTPCTTIVHLAPIACSA